MTGRESTGGTYTLVLCLPVETTIKVGALGTQSFPAGWYAYVGSALGPGGFSRIERHRAVAVGDHDVRHWHIDYLLGETPAEIETVFRSVAVDAECAVADTIDGEPIPGFGCSDCDCLSHLFYSPSDSFLISVERAHDRL